MKHLFALALAVLVGAASLVPARAQTDFEPIPVPGNEPAGSSGPSAASLGSAGSTIGSIASTGSNVLGVVGLAVVVVAVAVAASD